MIQKDPMRFRRNLERVGEIFAYEISKSLTYRTKEITTPLGIAKIPVIEKQPVLATILRAGLPLHQGLLNFFDRGENCFISAYRKYGADGEFPVLDKPYRHDELARKIRIVLDGATGVS